MGAQYIPSVISDIKSLDASHIKANLGLRKLYNKIAPWTKTGAVSSLESYRNVNPSQVNYIIFGDSTGGSTCWNPTSASAYSGALYGLAKATVSLGGGANPFTTSGDYWVTDGSTHAYDYTVNWNGQYYHIGSGTGVANWGVGSAADPGTEKFIYAIVENDNVTTRTFTLALQTSASAAISVNGVTATMTVDCKGAALAIKKCGFCYVKYTVTSATGGTYTLSFGGLTTSAIAYNATAATVQAAIEALSASLVGNVGVSLSSSTYTVLINCNGLAFNWQALTANVTSLTPTTAAYILFANNGINAAKMVTTSISGDCRFLPPISFDRSRHGVCAYSSSRGGLDFSEMNGITASIANAIIRDLQPDICTVEEYSGQAGTSADLASFISWTGTAANMNPDWIHLSYAPSSGVTDAATITQNADLKSQVEAASRIYIDRWTGCPGYSVLTGLGWEGDGTHLSYKYYQWAASVLLKQLGLDSYVGVAGYRPLNIQSGLVQGVLQFSNNSNNAASFGVGHASGAQLDAVFQVYTSNRGFFFYNSAGTSICNISSNDSVTKSFVPRETRLGSITAPQIACTGVYTTAVTTANITVTAINADNAVHVATGLLTGNRQWILPLTAGKIIAFHNNTTGAFTLTVIGATGTGYAVTQTKKCMLYCDGTNWYQLTAEL